MADSASNTSSNDDQKMSREEAGKLGGEATSKTHDRKFYEEIGSEGGKVSGGNFKNDPERASKEGSKSNRSSDNSNS